MSDNHESHTPESTEPGSSTSIAENAATDLGHQQPNTDTEDILPELVGGVAVVPAESAADNQPTESSMASQNLQTSQDIHDDVENILPELAMVPYTGATSLIGGYQTTSDYTIIQTPQLIHTNAVHTPSVPPVPIIGSTASNLAYPLISTGHLQQALISAFELNTNISAGYGNPIGFIDALVPNFVGMWGGAMHQSIACMDARRFRRTPSREEVVTFIEGLEKIDVEHLESNDREYGICRGPYGDAVSMNNRMPENPTKLPCGHVFGVECLTLLLSPKPEGWGHSLCPLCRVRVEVPQAAGQGEPPATEPAEDEDDMPLLTDS